MCFFSCFTRFSIPLVAAAALAASTMHAQDLVPNASSDAASNPTTLTPWHDTVPEKLLSASIHDGVLSVDGFVAKLRLNYQIHDSAYMYIFLPGTGTAIVSLSPMPNATRVKDLFHGSQITFSVDGHIIEVSSTSSILKSGSSTGYVLLDAKTALIGHSPMLGYGMTARPPYVWPLSGRSMTDSMTEYTSQIPASMLPRTQN